MFRLTLTPGDYFTIDGGIVVQMNHVEGERAHVAVEAPREMPIVRGAVLEREGGKRPACLLPVPEAKKQRWMLWDQKTEDSLRAAQNLLNKLETPDTSREIAALRAQLENISKSGPLEG